MLKTSSLIILFASSLLLAECKVDYSVMYSIANCEKHGKREVGYPYLISFNSKKEAKKAKQVLKLNWLDSRSVDCLSLNKCKENLESLEKLGIKNLDLGAYQINKYWFDYKDYDEYFVLVKSYENACTKVYQNYKDTKVWSWETIARYHSKTPKFNKKYASCLQKKYSSLNLQGDNK